jgi:hypothetical protein
MGKVFKKVLSVGGAIAGGFAGAAGGPAGILKGAASGAQIGGTIGGLFGGGGGGGGGGGTSGGGNVAGGAFYDPFAESRGIYANRLNTLMSASPKDASNLVMNTPGYMGGLRAGERELSAGLARTGQVASGAEQVAYGNLGQDYFRKSYQDLYNQYSTLSGATQNPLNMASANELANSQNRLQDQSTGQAIGALGDIFTSVRDGWNSSSSPGGYAAGATDYAPMNTNIGMGNYQGPANMGGGTIGPNWGSPN